MVSPVFEIYMLIIYNGLMVVYGISSIWNLHVDYI